MSNKTIYEVYADTFNKSGGSLRDSIDAVAAWAVEHDPVRKALVEALEDLLKPYNMVFDGKNFMGKMEFSRYEPPERSLYEQNAITALASAKEEKNK